MQRIRLKALAKINLGLDVLSRRPDGYHEVRMIMQTINMFDSIEISRMRGRNIVVETNLNYLPTNEKNLVYKAAKLLFDEFRIRKGIHISLNKFIPVAAGMAGGSSDAAATLFGLNVMFGLGLSLEQLMKRGLDIGADVPFCLMRGTALAEGIGERLSALPPMPQGYVLIAKPPISISTKHIYENLDLKNLNFHPDIDAIIEGLRRQDIKQVAGNLGNVMETVTEKEYPIITQLKDFMKQSGALNAMMSGSGPTVFGIFEDKKTAECTYKKIKHSGLTRQTFLTDFYNNSR